MRETGNQHRDGMATNVSNATKTAELMWNNDEVVYGNFGWTVPQSAMR